ncbi:Dynamin central region-containing protein 2 [Elsinoe fawcettii]|nr:Dynamin central region-containing protein 2 [Elsinoe fawcettii]
MLIRQPFVEAISEFDTDERLEILSIIDRLRQLGIQEDIPLPQLVVVGDQSSGKSSLLEGLTGLSFPIASELCTRYATQITLRRAHETESMVRVSILPGHEANLDENRRDALLEFSRELPLASLDGGTFLEILNSAAVMMGLPPSQVTDVETISKRFSDDVLRIELSGPEHHHLSIVDVPGLFHNATKYQTEEDRQLIRQLLLSYMEDKRTIILAVMDARNNLANQEVFAMAREADPKGRRTLGIITKCDALQSGDEDTVLKVAQNEVEILHHGWFVVRNRSTEEIAQGVTLAERHQRERRLFREAPWKQLPGDRRGIGPLKKHLGTLLHDHIKSEYPTMVEDIRQHVRETQAQLDALGPPRQNTIQQRQYLSQIVSRLQTLTLDALRGNYNSCWATDDPRKLRMLMCATSDNFGLQISLRGHTRAFRTPTDEIDQNYRPHLDDVEDIYEWIRQQYKQNRGAELPGTINPNILQAMFRQQAAGWRRISEGYIGEIHDLARSFLDAATDDVVADDSVRERLKIRCNTPFRQAGITAQAQLEAILEDELGGILQTVNHYFADNLNTCREDRVIHRLQRLGLYDGQKVPQLNFGAITRAAHLSNEDQAVFDIHDILKAYYKVALKRFIDTVLLQVTERVYVGESGPLKFLSTEFVLSLDDQELDSIAGESLVTANARIEVTQRLHRLQSALQVVEGKTP